MTLEKRVFLVVFQCEIGLFRIGYSKRRVKDVRRSRSAAAYNSLEIHVVGKDVSNYLLNSKGMLKLNLIFAVNNSSA